ncbi:hypothetical protein ACH4PU_31135 [Streptomyces sp. NPDC021100]|uniref:hypothetical protein n=1 Tax=Streptomyces sp. NPDC021100 TaxID=3365114 RepID=UPI0037A5BC60
MNAIANAQAVITRYQQISSPEPLATTASDLIADLILWSAHQNLDWDAILCQAEAYASGEGCCPS